MKFDFCVACGSADDLQHHHLVMKSEGGSDAETNWITLCRACHDKVHMRTHGTYVQPYNHGSLVRIGQERARAEGKRFGPRQAYQVKHPETIVLARRLRRERKSLSQIAGALHAAGHVPIRGRAFSKAAIMKMLKGLPKVGQGRRPWLM